MSRLRAIMMQTSKGAIAPPAPPKMMMKESSANRGLTILQRPNAPIPIPLPRRRISDQEFLIRKAEKKAARLIPSAITTVQDKEELHYGGSSGSDHEPSTACLAQMVRDFLQEEEEEEEEKEVKVGSCGRARCNCLNGTRNGAMQGLPEEEEEEQGGKEKAKERSSGHSLPTKENHEEEEDDDDDDNAWIQSFLGANACEILEGVTSCTGPFELRLLADVAAALQAAKPADVGPTTTTWNSQTRLRAVMWHLRGAGYDAAVCKSRWNPSVGFPAGNGFPAGDYEYIDVITTGETEWGLKARSQLDQTSRYIVDIEFQAQFEIARPSRHYWRLLAVLPGIFVGRPGRLKQAVGIMADAAKRSLRRANMHVPPWRRQGYMLAKWMSSYKRTANPDPSSCTSQPLQLPVPSVAVKGPEVTPGFLLQLDEFEHRQRTKKLYGDAVLRRPSILTVVCSSWQLPVLLDQQRATKGQGQEEMASALAYALSQHKPDQPPA